MRQRWGVTWHPVDLPPGCSDPVYALTSCTVEREGLQTVHIQTMQTSLSESVEAYYRASHCSSGQEGPQKETPALSTTAAVISRYCAVKERCPEAQVVEESSEGEAASWYGAAGRSNRCAQHIKHLASSTASPAWRKNKATVAPFCTWQDLKRTNNQPKKKRNRAEPREESSVCRKRKIVFAFVSADAFEHFCFRVCVWVGKVGYLSGQVLGPLPYTSKTARVSC